MLELEITEITDDDTYKYYQSKTEGFSTFAIFGSEIKSLDHPSINWFLILGGVVVCVILIIAILFKLGYFYFVKEESKGKYEKKGKVNNFYPSRLSSFSLDGIHFSFISFNFK